MNLEEKKHFYKSKGFYISCFLGLFAILSVVGIQKNMEQKNLADLGAEQESTKLSDNSIQEEASADQNHTFDAVNENPDQEPVDIAAANTSEPTEAPEKTSAPEKTKAPAETKAVPKSDAAISTTKTDEESEKTEESVAVLNAEDANQGLTWPIEGKIILNYSMDKSVYFSTLGQYKCNPAIILSGAKGDKVVSACDCKITDVSRNDETGLTVTATSGNYKFVYGQLANLKVAKGDTIKEGDTIGTLAEPSKYYTKEGCNLYFQILEDGESVNPLLLLK